MPSVTLGKCGIAVEKNGFGALPIQRVSMENATSLLHAAYENGTNLFDTARAYTDSEEKIGHALRHVRKNIVLATKTHAKNVQEFWKHLESSLRLLKTDYIDIYQLHNPEFCPLPGDESGLYDAALQAKTEGKIRFIGITNHRLPVAKKAVQSGCYDTLQFPLSYLATVEEEKLVESCKQMDVGFLGMKALCGGLLTRADAAYAYMAKFDNVVPLWGIQRMQEMEDFIRFRKKPPMMTDEIKAVIMRERNQFSGSFCRGCGYCMPCPVGIEINTCARMSLLLRRSPSQQWLSEKWQKQMDRINGCMDCGACKRKCPYFLDIPHLLQANLKDYQEVLSSQTYL